MEISSALPESARIVVLVVAEVIFRAAPSCSSTVSSNFIPRSLDTYSAPVTMAMSWRSALRRSPKPGALTAQTWMMPRILLTTRVASASPTMSSQMITSGAPALAACSRMGMICLAVSTLWSATRTRQLSNSQTWRSGLVTNCGEMNPRSICMPSCTSTLVSRELEDSMERTPSAPTLSRASAMSWPTNSSLPAEIEATALIWSKPETGRAFSRSFSMRKLQVLSMPRLTNTGFAPEVTTCMPNLMSSAASTQAVVVPSPAASLVRPATSLISCAPAFSTGCSSSMARAIETPSLITWGTP
mmetsp:Transcript_33075/g.78438  ORF Transcript_33075/g.78438 Transcript_33075/m.78438 type:complete len:301 (+) Transcript_33075:166-1068(+)